MNATEVFVKTPDHWIATGTYVSGSNRHLIGLQQLQVGDTAELQTILIDSPQPIVVLVKVQSIDEMRLFGEIVCFEDLDEESVNKLRVGDSVEFSNQNVFGWIG